MIYMKKKIRRPICEKLDQSLVEQKINGKLPAIEIQLYPSGGVLPCW